MAVNEGVEGLKATRASRASIPRAVTEALRGSTVLYPPVPSTGKGGGGLGGWVAVAVPVAEAVAVAGELPEATLGLAGSRAVAWEDFVPTRGEGVVEGVVEPVAVVVEERHRVGESVPLPLTERVRVGEGVEEGQGEGVGEGGGLQYPNTGTHEEEVPAVANELTMQESPLPQVPQKLPVI